MESEESITFNDGDQLDESLIKVLNSSEVKETEDDEKSKEIEVQDKRKQLLAQKEQLKVILEDLLLQEMNVQNEVKIDMTF